MENEEEGKEIVTIAKIEEMSQKSKEDKSWTRYSFKIGGKLMSTFDNRLKDFKAGDVVQVMYKKSGMYTTILDMKLAEQSQIVTADKIKSEPDQRVWIEKDKRIIRQNCNQRSIELLDVLWKYSPEKVEQILKANGNDIMKLVDFFSQHFENRVWRGEIEEVVF